MNDMQMQAVGIYKKFSTTPTVNNVYVINDHVKNVLQWQAKWSHRDVTRHAQVSYITTGSLTCKNKQLVSSKSPLTNEVTTEKLISISSLDLKAYLHEIQVKSEKHYFLEIWKESVKLSSINLTKENKHGIVHTNSIFGFLNWSNASDKLVYVAEKKASKSKSFFERSEDCDEVGNEFIHKEDWGEQLVGSYHPTLFMYDVHTGEITDLSEFLPDDASISCALWSEDDKSLYILGWKASPWKLSLIYSKSRYSTIFHLNLTNKLLTPLTNEQSCVFSPIMNPRHTQLLYLETIPLGPHRQCCKLMCLDLNKDLRKSSRVVVDIVKHQSDTICFQGLFIPDKMADNCWLANGHQLIVSSYHRSNQALLCIDINSGLVKLLEIVGKWQVFYVANDILFVSFSAPSIPTVFKVGKYDPEKIAWLDVDIPVPTIKGISWEVLSHKPIEVNQNFPELDYESVLIKPTDVPVNGLIVCPHGGPHSLFIAEFDLFTACFCQLGYAVLRINFRGSPGFGQNNIFSLLGNVGHQDMLDVQQATEKVVDKLAIPSAKVFAFGGSHGGYLILHLVSQFPDFYRAGAVRNPNANLTLKPGTCDNVDWCFVETGEKFSYDIVSTSHHLLNLLKCSPIAGIDKVKTPLLFMLGLVDLRVPPFQSFQYTRALKGLGKKVKVLAYPNNSHSISGVDAEADCFVNTVKWFFEHME